MKTIKRIMSALGWPAVCLTRGMALFLGIFAALSFVGYLMGDAYNSNIWWIDLDRLPRFVSMLLQAASILVLVAFCIRVPSKLPWRIAGTTICSLFALVAIENIVVVYKTASQGLVILGFPLPFSFFIFLSFVILALAMFFGYRILPKPTAKGQRVLVEVTTRATQAIEPQVTVVAGAHIATEPEKKPELEQTPRRPRRPRTPQAHRRPRQHSKVATAIIAAIAVLFCGVAFPVGQMMCFGTSDYRSQVDAVVVFGAQVHPDGTLSMTLTNRVNKAIELYEQGYTPVLIMSGGTGVEGVNEAEAMRSYALEHGVPASAIIIDSQGNNSVLTVENTLAIAKEHGFDRLGAVSSFYHLPRIEMLYLFGGINASTIPASNAGEGPATLTATVREIPGWWYYWFTFVLR